MSVFFSVYRPSRLAGVRSLRWCHWGGRRARLLCVVCVRGRVVREGREGRAGHEGAGGRRNPGRCPSARGRGRTPCTAARAPARPPSLENPQMLILVTFRRCTTQKVIQVNNPSLY